MYKSAIRELRQQRVRLVEQANEILKKSHDEKRTALTAEEEQEFDRLEAEAKALQGRIEREERALEMNASLEGSAGLIAGDRRASSVDPRLPNDPKELGELQCRAFNRWAAGGEGALEGDDAVVLKSLRVSPSKEQRDQGVGTGAGGGFLVPTGFFPQIDLALKMFGSVMAAEPQFVDTDAGNDLPWPTINDTGNVGELVAEHAAAAEQDVVVAQPVLKAFYYSSKLVEVSWELLQDAAFDFGQVIAPILGERIGRITNQHFTTGTGSGQPQGVVTGSTLGKTAAGAAVITFAEWIDLVHSVDPAYRALGAKVMTSDTGLAMLRKVVDTTGQPLFQAGGAGAAPDLIGGYRIVINQDMAVPASTAKSILFGWFGSYKVRRVRGIELFRITEPYISKRQTAFVAFARMDGRLINAGTNPIKHLVHT